MLLVSLLICIGSSYVYAQDKFQDKVDILHYQFKLNIYDATNLIEGETTVKAKFNEPGVLKLVLDFIGKGDDYGNYGMEVDSITSYGSTLDFLHKKGRLLIYFNTPAGLGEEKEFTIYYKGVPSDGLIISDNKYRSRTFFADNWPNRARYWLPVEDHPSDKATCEFIVTAPNHYQVVSNGYQVEITDIDNHLRLTHWRTDVAIPTKVMVIGVARFSQTLIGYSGNIPVSAWVYPQDRDKGFYDYELAKDVVDYFSKSIGPYSYEKLANIQSKTRYGGMENASAIFYNENSVTGTRSSEALIAHEVAHQWFGNSASEKEWPHIWLSEGFATYFTALYLEDKYGRKKLVETLKSDKEKVLSYNYRKPEAIIVYSPADLNQLLNPYSYQKGAWVLHMLRFELGETNFWKGIQLYYERYKNSNATSIDFQKAMEDASGKQLGVFFEQWLYNPGHPVIDFSYKYNERDKKLELKFKQVQKTDVVFEFPIQVAVKMENGETKLYTYRIDGEKNSFEADMPSVPVNVVLDPDTWLLYELTD